MGFMGYRVLSNQKIPRDWRDSEIDCDKKLISIHSTKHNEAIHLLGKFSTSLRRFLARSELESMYQDQTYIPKRVMFT
jgi:hypothetical protein